MGVSLRHYGQRTLNMINDSIPPRYEVKLENRPWAKLASREGEAHKEFRRLP